MKSNRIQYKKEILAASSIKQESVIADFNERIHQMMATDGDVNEEAYDTNVQAHKAETMTEVSLLSDQLQFAKRELYELKKLEWDVENQHFVVAFGTVVVTDRGTFFVSASIEDFSIDGNPICGISILSPLYKAMRGKKAGQTFTCGKKHYLIKEIF